MQVYCLQLLFIFRIIFMVFAYFVYLSKVLFLDMRSKNIILTANRFVSELMYAELRFQKITLNNKSITLHINSHEKY